MTPPTPPEGQANFILLPTALTLALCFLYAEYFYRNALIREIQTALETWELALPKLFYNKYTVKLLVRVKMKIHCYNIVGKS